MGEESKHSTSGWEALDRRKDSLLCHQEVQNRPHRHLRLKHQLSPARGLEQQKCRRIPMRIRCRQSIGQHSVGPLQNFRVQWWSCASPRAPGVLIVLETLLCVGCNYIETRSQSLSSAHQRAGRLTIHRSRGEVWKGIWPGAISRARYCVGCGLRAHISVFFGHARRRHVLPDELESRIE